MNFLFLYMYKYACSNYFSKLSSLLKIQMIHSIVEDLGEFFCEFKIVGLNGNEILLFCDPGKSPDVANNLECTGRYSFIHFKASAICFTDPRTTGRYVGIMTTKSQILQLCEVEIYSRGNLT